MRYAIFLMSTLLAAAAVHTSYIDEAVKWRADYEASLKAPNGWLSVAGLFWLHEGANVVGSSPQSDVALPPGTPSRAGVLQLKNRKVTFQPVGKPAGNSELKSDITEHPDTLRIGDAALTIIDRGGKIGVRIRDPNAETRRDFTGCKWFSADEAWRIKAKWVAYAQPKKIPITNILGMTDEEPSPGYAEFTFKGQKIRLQPVSEDDQLFFMFKDATTGKTTYPAGRFLYAPVPKGDEVVLDFNQAHNPPCAFTAFATCPLPPKQNTMPMAVEAGEKNYGKH